METANEELTRFHVGHDLSTQKRDHVNMLWINAQENIESESLLEFTYKLRGQPYDLKIVKHPNKVAKK